jgi:hypothetical protein
MYSDNIEYARGRLKGTIVMINGEPVLVDDIQHDATTIFRYLKTNEYDVCHVDDLDLVGQNKLGYVNYEDNSYHLVRKPLRHDWRQGLRMGNMVFTGPEGFYEVPLENLRHTILGIYPTFQQAAESVSEGAWKKRAFSRNFAVGQDNRLFYRERWVGTYDKLVMLQEKFKYLTESLNDIMEGNYAYD